MFKRSISALLTSAVLVAFIASAFFISAFSEPDSSGIGTRTYLVQDANDTVTASTTPVPTDLVTSIAANQKVHIRYVVPVSLSGTASGVKFLVNAPAGGSVYDVTVVLFTDADSIALSRALFTETAVGVTLANAGDHYAVIDAVIYNGSTAGTVSLDYAQNASDAGTVIVHKGAWADVTKF